jgi:hypothetical protein
MKGITEGKKSDTNEDTKEMVTRWTSMGSCINTYITEKLTRVRVLTGPFPLSQKEIFGKHIHCSYF